MNNIIDLFENANVIQKEAFIETCEMYAKMTSVERMLKFLLDKNNGDFFNELLNSNTSITDIIQ